MGTIATAAIGGLSGCGFQPLNARQDDGGSVSANLSTVRIEPLRDRVGQQMHNFLRDRLNPQGQPVSPSYRLAVQLTESLSELGVRRDETATRANLRIDAKFSLFDFGGGEALFSGSSSSTTSYDILENPFATTVSEEDARDRALGEVADDIQTRLSIYFSST
ncbi:LPS assembly lipoprotein LptE [Pelagibius sp. CAU 1746]|uniref:LPS assembly lipoprotein LptE n=1 Tax=Pelagibius sp. CAU 1746 TaxID=3140370 RepID=UPI00325B4580